ncbi:helix-turn-helix domain-containing protein [Streptomyces sp. NPDC088725]|uniref:helix-turn-helix domain-containing protein n=1 Tax=Streptomyces sp. NPDC088725 TaxID=3365873 RepID=UPI0037F47DE2
MPARRRRPAGDGRPRPADRGARPSPRRRRARAGRRGHRALLLRVRAFVQRHLHDPGLSPAIIAAAHNISVSYLHRLFRGHDSTVAAWIRGQRLEHARRDLADRTLRTVPVHRIAARWGFPGHATFTRAFRATYGLPPRDYRHQALGSPL